jgi:hypothetical protein
MKGGLHLGVGVDSKTRGFGSALFTYRTASPRSAHLIQHCFSATGSVHDLVYIDRSCSSRSQRYPSICSRRRAATRATKQTGSSSRPSPQVNSPTLPSPHPHCSLALVAPARASASIGKWRSRPCPRRPPRPRSTAAASAVDSRGSSSASPSFWGPKGALHWSWW